MAVNSLDVFQGTGCNSGGWINDSVIKSSYCFAQNPGLILIIHMIRYNNLQIQFQEI